MYEYTGREDSTKSCLAEWKLEDYVLVLKKITQAAYLDAKAGVAPYTVNHPAPTVSRCFHYHSQSQLMLSRLY